MVIYSCKNVTNHLEKQIQAMGMKRKAMFETQHPVYQITGQISIIPKPELRGFGGSSLINLIKPPFKVTSAEVVIICPEITSITGELQQKAKAQGVFSCLLVVDLRSESVTTAAVFPTG